MAQRVRIRYAKLGRLRWLSHRDMARLMERTLRRAELPLTYSTGMSPRVQLSFGLALPTGCQSVAEYVDVPLGSGSGDPYSLAAVINPLLPEGIRIMASAPAPPGESLQAAVATCSWRIEFPDRPSDLAEKWQALLGSTQLPVRRERKGRQVSDDIRPGILSGEVSYGAESAYLEVELATRPTGVRPIDLLNCLEGGGFALATRTAQWLGGESRSEPLALADPGFNFDPEVLAAPAPTGPK